MTSEISLDDAYKFNKIMDNIFNKFKHPDSYLIYEYNNCIERWIMSFINAFLESKSDKPLVSIFSSYKDESYNIKLKEELLEKRICASEPDAVKFVEEIFSSSKNMQVIVSPPGLNNLSSIDKMLLTIDKSKTHLATLKLLYESIARNKSQQWAIPIALYRYLYNNVNLRYEGFASPINSRLLRIGKDSYYCSMFYSLIDKYYHSIGSFFDVEFPNESTWFINPPYIVDIFDRMWKKMKNELSQKKSLLLFCTLPDWSDYYMYKEMNEHPALRAKLVLDKNKHHYENVDGKPVIAKFRSLVYIFDTWPKKKDINIKDMYDIFGVAGLKK